MPAVLKIKQTLLEATSLEQFRHKNGKRILGLPFFTLTRDGNLVFNYVNEETNPALLKTMISEHKIFLVDQHIKNHDITTEQ